MFEQGGQDRVEYGKQLLERLSVQLKERGLSRAEVRELRRYRQFYQAYSQIRDSLTPEFDCEEPPWIWWSSRHRSLTKIATRGLP